MSLAVVIPLRYLEQIAVNRYGQSLVSTLIKELNFVHRIRKTNPQKVIVDYFKKQIFVLIDKLELHYTCFPRGTLNFLQSVLRPIIVVNYVSLYKSVYGHQPSEPISKLRIHIEVEISVKTTEPEPAVEPFVEARYLQLQDEINILQQERLNLLKLRRKLYTEYAAQVLIVNQYLEITDRLDEIEIQLHYLYEEFQKVQRFLPPSQGPPLPVLQYHSQTN